MNVIKKLNALLTKRDKQFLLLLFVFSIVISIIETVGISVIMPFIAVATDFDLIQTNTYYHRAYTWLGMSSETGFVILFGCILIGFYFFRSGMNLFYFYLLYRFTRTRSHLISYRLFKTYLGLSYKTFISHNSSTLTKSIINEASHLTTFISALLLIMSELCIIVFLYGVMLYVNVEITLVLTFFLLLNALLMIKTVSVQIKKAGILREKFQKIFYEVLNKSFSNFKIIKLQSNDHDILSEFNQTSSRYANTLIKNSTLEQVPRLFLEAVGFSIVISIVIYFIWSDHKDISSVLSVISMFVLALYRLMPSVNRIMNGYNQVLFYYKAFDIVETNLSFKNETIGYETLEFNDQLVVKNLCFGYTPHQSILTDINLTIHKGAKIALVGESGSGKSTLVDILIGLHQPQQGELYCDDTLINELNVGSWRLKVGYIPQSVYLFDGTVKDNIVFGLPYDKEKVAHCLKKAQMLDFLMNKEGEDTLVGEGGVMLSGGQKQRIAIARALYRDPEILVLDEATSALDEITEKEIMDAIYDACEDKTLIIIAHRLSTIQRCDAFYTLNKGRLVL